MNSIDSEGDQPPRDESTCQESSNLSSLCRGGRWMVEEDAMDYLNLSRSEIYTIRSLNTRTDMVFEHGAVVHASYPFNKFRFVFISQPSTDANAEMTIHLPTWCKLCQCLQRLPPHLRESNKKKTA